MEETFQAIEKELNLILDMAEVTRSDLCFGNSGY